ARSASASLPPSTDRGWSVCAVRVWCDSAARSGSASWGASVWSKAWKCGAPSPPYPVGGPDPGVGPPWPPPDHTPAPHRRHGACEEADVMLRGHKGPRRSARPRIAPSGSHMRGAGQGYMLSAASTSAGPPILDGRVRPMSGELVESNEVITIAQFLT